MRIHDLRHTTATILLTQGVHPRAVMKTLGHRQISVTLDTLLPRIARRSGGRCTADGRGVSDWRSEWLSRRRRTS
jgi:integrase